MVIPARFERATPRLGIWCSIQLSYGTTVSDLAEPFPKSHSKVRLRTCVQIGQGGCDIGELLYWF